MSGIETPIPLPVLALWSLPAVGLLLLSHVRLSRAVPRRPCWAMTFLRGAALALVLALLLHPYRETREPDRDGFRVTALLDTSMSMAVTDLDGERERMTAVREAVAAPDSGAESPLQRLEDRYRLHLGAFAETVRTLRAGRPPPFMPGRTAVGDALDHALRDASPAPLGGVVLFSDGNSNHGSAPVEIAKQYRSRGIPVSCVGIGEPREPGDVRVRFGRPPAPPRKGDLVVLPVQVENRFPRPVTTRLTLADAGGPLDTRTLTVPAGETLDETFTTEAWRAGFLTYTVRMDAVTDDSRPDNDVDFLGLEVREPDTFRILYVAAHLGWEYRFLKILADGNRQLSLAAVIRLGENSFYKTDFSGEEEADAKGNGFPESPAALNRYEAILLDSRAAVEWSAPGIEALVSFVDRRGGGLLLVGPPDALPQPLRDLLPAQALAPDALRRQERLEANPEFVFDADPTRVLADPPGLPLVAGEELWLVREPKRGARMAAGIRHTEKGFLAAQSYGSGRTAYLGLESSWRWSLRDATGERGHRAFWNSLLVWLASSSRQRVRIASDGAKTGVGDPLVLDADILDTDFRPAADAKVTATVLSPSGTATEVALDPSVATPGRYGGVFFPDESGEYRVDYRIGIGDREERTQTHFVARRQGIETEETPYREDVLRDVARITGGAFLPYSRMAALAEGIPLSTHVPMRTSRTYWSDNALLLLLLVLVLGAEWYLRRRLGLR